MPFLQNIFQRFSRKSAISEDEDVGITALDGFDMPPEAPSKALSFDLADYPINDNAATPPARLFGDAESSAKRKTSKPKLGKSRPHRIIDTAQELQAVLNDVPPSNTILFITGDLVMLSGTDAATPADYTRQPDRITKSLTAFSKRAIPFTLKVWLHISVVEARRTLNRHKFCFAIDQYLQYGKSKKGKFNLVTGSMGDNRTIIQTLTFENGNLTAIEERVLPHTDNQRFAPDFAELLNTLRKSGLPITVTNPLPEQNGDLYAYADGEIYNKAIHYPITDDSTKPSFMTAHGLSIAILFIAIAAKLGALLIPYNTYSQATAEYQRVTATIPKDDLSFAADQLKVMQQRRFFLSEPRPQHRNINFLRETAHALSSEGVVIKNIELKPNKSRPEDPDIAIAIQTKRYPSESVLDQGKPILDNLSTKLGIGLHLAHDGHQIIKDGNGDIVQYNIEGNFKEQSK